MLRAIGFLGPPLLDGIGRPGLTLKYMIAAAVITPASFVVGAWLLGDRMGAASVAVAWALGYPLAFAVLVVLVINTVRIDGRQLWRATAGVAACSLAGFAVGLATRAAAMSTHTTSWPKSANPAPATRPT